MKVLSIKEPYASLIANGIKKIETRSWKTNYRGELYIHASLTTDNRKYDILKDLIDFDNLKNSYIICKCNLIDCIYMSKEFIENIKNNNTEYICGHYEEGRYAWVLDNIELLTSPIEVKGKLGIWNYEKK